jgi:hypothetical protein
VILQLTQRLADIAGTLQVPGAQQLVNSKGQLEAIDIDAALAVLRTADGDKLDARDLKTGVGKAGRLLDETCTVLAGLLGKTEAEISGRLLGASLDPEEKACVIELLNSELNAISQVFERYINGNSK